MTRPNTGQRLALNLDAHIAIDAGAGTGKTRTIVDRAIQHYLTERQRATEILPQPARPPRISSGILNSQMKDLTDPKNWKGLLPGEVVLLTFTNMAADEMKTRLRDRIKSMEIRSRDSQDSADPRLRSEADKEQLMMLLEDAPIGTIDSFFSRLVKPHLPTLGDTTESEIVTDAQRETLIIEAIDAFWRLPSDPNRFSVSDSELLQTDKTADILSARDRLLKLYSGRSRLNLILRGLHSSSILVDEASRSMSERGRISPSKLFDIITSNIDEEKIDSLFLELQPPCFEVMEIVKSNLHLLAPTGWGADDRIHELDHLALDQPETSIGRLKWISRLLSLSKNSPLDPKASVFPNNKIPSTTSWGSGLISYTQMGNGKAAKEVKSNLKSRCLELRSILNREDISAIIEHATIMIPLVETPGVTSVPYPPPDRVASMQGSGPLTLNIDGEAHHLQDLRMAMIGIIEISRSLKFKRKLRDFDDVSRLASDFLLVQCPRNCRLSGHYPNSVVNTLDKGPSEPWLDDHIERAIHDLHTMILSGASGHSVNSLERAVEDLQKRWLALKAIRRRFRAFIIDEAQDNSPLQWRLLARLWGPREVNHDEEIPETPWQPTVCYVGDVKQSVYAFRHAEASRFHEFTEKLRTINNWELLNIPTLTMEPPLRRKEKSRDPRYDLNSSFSTASNVNVASGRELEPWISFDQVDGIDEKITNDEKIARMEGLIRLNVNFRTKKGLLEEMNGWWREVFSERHKSVPGSTWYASPQDLRSPSPNDLCYGEVDSNDPSIEKVLQLQANGHLEWICPTQEHRTEDPPEDLDIPIDPLASRVSGRVRRNARFIAMRVKSLIEGKSVKIKSPDGQWSEIKSEKIKSSDIMILMATRTGIRDALLEELGKFGIKAHADQEGDLFKQPVVKAIEGLFQLCARPFSRHHAAWVARSPLIGMSDDELDEFLSNCDGSSDLIQQMSVFLGDTPLGRLSRRWFELNEANNMHQILHDTLDQSDLLIAYPSDTNRQDAERAVKVILEMLQKEGGSKAAAADVLRSLREDVKDGVKSRTNPQADSVRIMSIHRSKGLEAKVVILADLFSDRQVGLSHQNLQGFAVTADIFAGNPKPWGNSQGLQSAVWNYSKWINKSRRDAENRRLLYVAATRAEDRLILVGSHDGRNASRWIEGSGVSFFHDSRTQPSLGSMITNAMRSRAWKCGEHTSPWLSSDDILSDKNPSKRVEIVLDPNELQVQHERKNASSSIGTTLIHSYDCLEQEITEKTPYVRLNQAIQAISESPIASMPKTAAVFSAPRHVKIAPSSLHDASDANHFGPKGHESSNISNQIDLHPSELGNIVHRIVEVGIGHPGGSFWPPLPNSWTMQRPHRMTDDYLIESVLNEIGIESNKGPLIRHVKNIMQKINHGHLGMLSRGEQVCGHALHGHRTELPFIFSKTVTFPSIIHGNWTPYGLMETSIENRAVVKMEGFIDLVICTEDQDGRPTIRAVDVKTDSTVSGISDRPVGDDHNPRTDFEFELLRRHGNQLAVYHEALRAMNKQSPLEMQRNLLPPAIVWAGNGRMIEYPAGMIEDFCEKVESTLSFLARDQLSN